MAKPSKLRVDLLKQLDETLRKVGAQSVLLSESVARIIGVNSTDLECLDLLELAGPITAGRLAQHTGLTTGAMTTVIDRLEQAGFVRRLPDPDDRRCVRVEALSRNFRQVAALYRRLADGTAKLHEDYDDRQLAMVVEYLTRALALAADHVTWLQTQQPVARRPKRTRQRQARTARPRSSSPVIRN